MLRGAGGARVDGKLNRDFDNWIAMIHDLATGADVWSSRPSWLEFATNNRCNLRCLMCGNPSEPSLGMARADAQSLLSQVLPHMSLVTPSANSEPLLADLELILAECRRHDVYLDMYSNATLLDGERFRAMADRMYRLHLSFDSHIPEVYERVRVGAHYDQVVHNIREIVQVATERGIPVVFVMVMMTENVPHLPGYVDFIAELGGSRARAQIRVQSLDYYSPQCPDLDPQRRYTNDQIAAWLDGAVERAVEHGIIFTVDADEPLHRTVTPAAPIVRGIGPDVLNRFLETVRRRYPHFCAMAACYLKVDPSGAVFPCCYAPPELEMGNVHESSVDDIWNGSAYRRFRRRMATGDYPAPCAKCTMLTRNLGARQTAPATDEG
jgi:radical SAM protein with 4Fe4S-binding SPASM domain